MSFLKSPLISVDESVVANIAQALQYSNSDLIFDYNNLDFISNTLMLDNSGPILDYDMWRYVDQTFIDKRYFFYDTIFHFDVYSDYLRTLVEEYGKKVDSELYGSWESHHLFLFSTLKKLFVLQYSNFQLDQIDFYILDWAKHNMSQEEFFECRRLVIDNPNSIKAIDVKDDFY